MQNNQENNNGGNNNHNGNNANANKSTLFKNATKNAWSFNGPHVQDAIKVTGLILLALLSVFVFVKTINEVKSYTTIGQAPNSPYMITVSGTGEVTANKDVALLSFTSYGKGATATAAQTQAAEANNKALAALRARGVEEKDITTESYYTTPTYDQKVKHCIIDNVRINPSGDAAMTTSYTPTAPCNSYEQVITGYETSQSVQVKIRNINTNPGLTGEIITALGQTNVRVGNLQNTIDNPEGLENQARQIAIANAREEAKQIARSLGARLGKVVSFNEDRGMYPMYESARAFGAADAKAVAVPNPEIPTGEGKVTSNVSVTFEIKQ